jgi:hypothetical protein
MCPMGRNTCVGIATRLLRGLQSTRVRCQEKIVKIIHKEETICVRASMVTVITVQGVKRSKLQERLHIRELSFAMQDELPR